MAQRYFFYHDTKYDTVGRASKTASDLPMSPILVTNLKLSLGKTPMFPRENPWEIPNGFSRDKSGEIHLTHSEKTEQTPRLLFVQQCVIMIQIKIKKIKNVSVTYEL